MVLFSKNIKKVYYVLQDLLFPPSCVVCGRKIKQAICCRCLDDIRHHKSKSYSNLSFLRSDNRFIRNIFYLGFYEGTLKKNILSLKIRKTNTLARDFAIAIEKSFMLKQKGYDCIVPVPGYRSDSFHTARPAFYLSQITGIPIYNGLVKFRNTGRQKDKTRQQRMSLARESYQIMYRIKKNSKILIFDDIITTGATLSVVSDKFRGCDIDIICAGLTRYSEVM
ncbi:MAG: ComF family protein [Candidatus Muiribacteriaceae bacterium]